MDSSGNKTKIRKRRGGRPFRYGEPTKLVRVPLSFLPFLDAALRLWVLANNQKPVARNSSTRSQFLRSLEKKDGRNPAQKELLPSQVNTDEEVL
jgi:hypothetical protein